MENTNQWEEMKGNSRFGEPLIILKAGKLIGFNASFMKENRLEGNKYVKLFAKENDEAVMIGFIFYPEVEGGKKLSRSGRSVGAFTSAAEIFNRFVLNPSKMEKTKFKPKKEMRNDEELYYIEIPKNQIS